MTATTTPAVELVGLTKRFGDHLAVDSVDLTVPPGTFYGIVGPNGAGKSTTLSMIAGVLAPDAGSVRVAGFDTANRREEAQGALGIMLEGLSLPERLTGAELLEYAARLRGLGPQWRLRASDLLEVLELDRAPSTLIVHYSTGMRKKIGLAVGAAAPPAGAGARRAARSHRPGLGARRLKGCCASTSTVAGPCCCPATSWTSCSARANGWP